MSLKLTKRENEILSLVAKGKTNPEIAKTFGIRESSVKNSLQNIYRKLNVRNRVEATLAFLRVKP